MEHRQFGYALLCASAIGAVAFVGSNCSAPFTTGELFGGAGGSTSSNGGAGGVIATGGGGSSVGGSPTGGSAPGGSPPAGGFGGIGGQGGVVSPVYCGPDQVSIPTSGIVVCWYLSDHHPPGTTMGLGGIIKEPGSSDVEQSPFAGCVTSNPSENTLVCPFGDLAVGTDFVFDPYATDGVTTFLRCDVSGLPTSQCFGEYWVFVDGVEVAYFIDPPTGRWSYGDSGTHLRLVYNDPT